ncbi:sigma-54 interaction domain-containing protein [Bacillus sp. FJAT-29937]|uniref:sigma-54 interaction domain-containing protein n=1 Tax=Bacillus sp. FJAT-29937 TaxID=1720553 RepID=UPI0008346A33|nr:sigma 54-interacting transcriptional regulator [Bacillus sp. FJAT-29937]
MSSILFEIQDEVILVAEAIKSVLSLEVIIYDLNKVVVAATGGGQHAVIGEPVRGHIISEVLKTNKPVYNLEPGFHEICKSCILYESCPEKADVSYPLKHEGENVGVISLTAFSEEQKLEFKEKHLILSNYLGKMADLISSKINGKSLLKKYLSTSRMLQVTIQSMNEGIISVDRNGYILELNRSAEKILKIYREEVLKQNIIDVMPDLPIMSVLSTGKGFSNLEFALQINGMNIQIISSATPLVHDSHIIGVAISFKDLDEFRKIAYSITTEADDSTFDTLVGKSLSILQVKSIAKKVATTDSTVIILGESGTGKELFARAIHKESKRVNKPFRAINCAAIPEQLLESELFGYSEGAFTGARKKGKPGKFEMADGGTLFLDEIGDMPLHLQVKILRVLEERRVERVGSNDSIEINIRVIAATNKNLEQMVKDGEFREDLFYRLNVIPLKIPPLRERDGDVSVLLRHFVKHYDNITGKKVRGFTPEAEEMLCGYSWPGNIRELQNTVEYAINMATDHWITIDNLPPRIRDLGHPMVFNKNITLAEMEENMIREAINKYGDSLNGKKQAAKELGINLATLYRKIGKYQNIRKVQI